MMQLVMDGDPCSTVVGDPCATVVGDPCATVVGDSEDEERTISEIMCDTRYYEERRERKNENKNDKNVIVKEDPDFVCVF